MNLQSIITFFSLVFFICTIQAQEYKKTIQISNKEQIVMGTSNWEGTDDCSASAKITLTKNKLIVSVKVSDDKLNADNKSFYQNDGIELYFDIRPYWSRGENHYSRGVFKINAIPGFSSHYPDSVSYYPLVYPVKIPGLKVTSKTTTQGYTITVTIPETGLRENHFSLRKNFRFDLGINDADDGKRETQLMWNGKATNWDNPKYFGKIDFGE